MIDSEVQRVRQMRVFIPVTDGTSLTDGV